MGKIIERVRARTKTAEVEGGFVLGLNVRQVAYIKAKHAQETGEAVPPGLRGLQTIRLWWMKHGRRFPSRQVAKEIMSEHELDMAWAQNAFVVAAWDSKFPHMCPPESWVTPEAMDAAAKAQLQEAEARKQYREALKRATDVRMLPVGEKGEVAAPELCEAMKHIDALPDSLFADAAQENAERKRAAVKPSSWPPEKEDDPRPYLLQQLARFVGLR